jgi:hypothetical protein
MRSVAQQNIPPFVVIELFTSEGCSSCPPADALLKKIAKEAEDKKLNIFPLAFHVDYWNRLGWHDPFSKLQFTVRQENYSRVLPGKQIYTPQAVVNGISECVGSNEKELRSLIASSTNRPASISVIAKADSVANDTLYVSYALSEAGKDFSLRFALTENSLSSDVLKGENAGKKFMHENVVRIFTSSDSPAKKGTYKIPLKGIKLNEKFQLTVFLQQKQTMAIMGAERIGF